jgi:hypothetical protein
MVLVHSMEYKCFQCNGAIKEEEKAYLVCNQCYKMFCDKRCAGESCEEGSPHYEQCGMIPNQSDGFGKELRANIIGNLGTNGPHFDLSIGEDRKPISLQATIDIVRKKVKDMEDELANLNALNTELREFRCPLTTNPFQQESDGKKV